MRQRAARSEAILEVPRLLEIARELRLSLALDLKGAARNRFSAHLRWLADEVIRRELERSVVIWVPSVTFAKQLQRAPNGPLRLARARRSITPEPLTWASDAVQCRNRETCGRR